MNKCVGLDCGLPPVSLGLYCSKHYGRFKKWGDCEVVKYAKRGSGHVRDNGYRYLSIDGRQKGEHIIVAEKKYKRNLLSNEVVHHINEDKLDNRPENLVIMDRGDYVSYHQKKNKTKNNAQVCTKCGITKPLNEYNKAATRDGRRSNCKQCDLIRHKEYYHKQKYSKPELWKLDLSRLGKINPDQ